jgi:hypothetical protein
VVAFNIAFGILSGYFPFIWFPFFYIFVFAIGFFGARDRNPNVLMVVSWFSFHFLTFAEYIVFSVIILIVATIFLVEYVLRVIAAVILLQDARNGILLVPVPTAAAILALVIITLVLHFIYYILHVHRFLYKLTYSVHLLPID